MNDTPASKSIEQLRTLEKADKAAMPTLPDSGSSGAALKELTGDPSMWILNPVVFEHLWRIATALARSQLVPKTFQGKTEDCFIATQMAVALKCQPMQVLQNLYIVHGNPGFSAKFSIALANDRGPFDGVIQFKETSEAGKPDFAVTAYARIRKTGQLVERTVSMKTATAEGWAKNNPKYQSMPEQMLAYRAATFLIRLYCPEVLLGMATSDELMDTRGHFIDGEVVPSDVGQTYTATETIDKSTGEVLPAPVKQPPEAEKTSKPVAPKADKKPTPPAKAPAKDPDVDKAQTASRGPTFNDVINMIGLAEANSEDDCMVVLDAINGFKGKYHDDLINASAERFGKEMIMKLTGKDLPAAQSDEEME